MRLVFDAEANGLLNVPVHRSEADTIWCVCAVDIQSGETFSLIQPTAWSYRTS